MLYTIKGTRFHSKASEKYVDAIFHYDDVDWKVSIPVEYRRTGVNIPSELVDSYVKEVYDECHPKNRSSWVEVQREYWSNRKAKITSDIFFSLTSFEWICSCCGIPKNANFARRVQDIKECGYTIATDTSMYCHVCDVKKTHLLLLPLKRGSATGYEVWSSSLRERIVNELGRYDVYEAKVVSPQGLLPDHKFPEIRWDVNTKRNSLEDITNEEILRDFQLLNNQRNQQKREACRTCFQTGIRGYPYGIKYYYHGEERWDISVPLTGKEAEKGCIGCGWYDLEKWRSSLNRGLV